jgi:uncharacterized protein (DUF608 family)
MTTGLGTRQSAPGPEISASTRVQGKWPFVLPEVLNDWTRVEVDGFAAPIPACVYEGTQLNGGMPLGGLGTGYLTLEGNGKLGYCSIFNELVPPAKLFSDWLCVESGTRSVPLSTAQIWYLGHFPVADLQAVLAELPLEIGVRAFAPYIVGDAAVSNTPVALFELELRNTSTQPLLVTLHLKFPTAPERSELAVRGEGVTPVADQKGQYSAQMTIPGQQLRHVRFAVGWYSPSWRDSSSEPHTNRYAQRFRSAADVAEYGSRNQKTLLERVLAWQGEIYRSALPAWLQDALVQGLYSHAKNTVWIARTRHDEWWGEDGWFTHSESHTGCPIVETMVCRIHGHFPLLFFFPELEATTLDAFRHFQVSDGEIPFCFGTPTSMRDPRYHCQHPLNSGQYAQMVYQLFLRTGNKDQALHFFDSVKRAIRYQYSLDDDHCGLVSDQPHTRTGEAWPANQFYDCWPWEGVSCYVAGTWLATLAAGKQFGELAGDRAFAAECAEKLQQAQRSYEQRLWNGSYYRLWDNRQAGTRNEVSLANQLMGEWCGRVSGLGSVLPEDRVSKALDTIERLNMGATSYGLINGVTPEGKPYDTKVHPEGDFGMNIFVGENLCAAMTFMYHGRKEVGLEIARRLYRTMAIKTRSPWNQRCLLHGDTGLPLWGDDYYSNVIIWAVPMALEGMSVKEFASTGLVEAMMKAAGRS